MVQASKLLGMVNNRQGLVRLVAITFRTPKLKLSRKMKMHLVPILDFRIRVVVISSGMDSQLLIATTQFRTEIIRLHLETAIQSSNLLARARSEIQMLSLSSKNKQIPLTKGTEVMVLFRPSFQYKLTRPNLKVL